MEPDDTPHHHHHHSLTPNYYSTPTPTNPNNNNNSGAASSGGGGGPITHSPTNGLLPPPPNSSGGSDSASAAHHMVYPHSVGPSSAAVSAAPVDPVRRKRGRPRKYGTPEQALAAKRTAAASSASSAREKRESGGGGGGGGSASYPGFSKKSHHHLGTPGNTGLGFTPHIISIAAGEDVAMKINMFMQQSKSETCILSASGVISSASIHQPATSGGNITYQGRFDIISLGGSYIRSETGGRTGGLSVCLSRTDGHIIGGGLCGPLIAAGAVQVIVGTFTLDNRKDGIGGGTSSMRPMDAASNVGKLPSLSGMSFPSPVESTGRNPVRENEDNHQTMGGGPPFMIHNRGPSMHHMAPSMPLDWRSGPDPRAGGTGYDLTGRTGLGGHRSPENGDYDQGPD